MFSCKFEYEKGWTMPTNLSELGRIIAENYPDCDFKSLTASLFSDKVEVITEFGVELEDSILKEICMFIYNYKEYILDETVTDNIVAPSAIKIEKTLDINDLSTEEKVLIFENIKRISR